MTPKEKAKNLVDRMYKVTTKNYADNDYAQILANKMWFSEAKESSTICVNEIINANTSCVDCAEEGSMELAYWGKVKREINKL